MSRDLHFVNFYPHPRPKLWAALTDSAALAIWLMPNDFRPLVGHRFQFKTKPAPGFNGIIDCVVLEMIPLERLVYSWAGGGISTTVRWMLKDAPGGTELTLEHTGFNGWRGFIVGSMLGRGWKSRILSVRLPNLLAEWDGTGSPPSAPDMGCHQSTAPNL